jgi:Fe-S-cluster containining protein
MSGVRRFACTQCGKCCDRSPEVELSEAGALADVFVFRRLMLRLYSLPTAPERGSNAELFYQKKRLLTAHAASAYSKKVMRDGRAVERMHYLMISALALNTRIGSCPALEAGRCNIYNRRPLGCRTVPFHYSRPDALAERDFMRSSARQVTPVMSVSMRRSCSNPDASLMPRPNRRAPMRYR